MSRSIKSLLFRPPTLIPTSRDDLFDNEAESVDAICSKDPIAAFFELTP